MTLRLEVRNDTDTLVGRAGYRFDPHSVREDVEVVSSYVREILDCPQLTAVVIHADSASEVPEGVEVRPNATAEAVRLAKRRGLGLFSIGGTGEGGRILKGDVEAHLSREEASTAEERAIVSTLDPPEVQREAERQAIEEMYVSAAGVRAEPTVPDGMVEPRAERGAQEKKGD